MFGRGEERGNERYRAPRVEILEQGDAVVLRAEMPGIAKEDFEINVEGDELTIRGKRKTIDSRLRLVYAESDQADFARTFALGHELDTSKVDAKVDRGVLTLTIYKKKEVLPKKISIAVE
ncbi:Hsp20/alpha crystallin family protein [Candidatus Poribacteria bacterium]|nr:Hsp20/alpha crystallin family protein [Candidatus Poribacteria bacterium]